MNLVSHLAAADCTSGVAGNIDISKHTCTIIYHQQDPDNMDVLEVISPQKRLVIFQKYLSSYITNKTQITWMYWKSSPPKTAPDEPSQPFGRSSLCAWQSSKLQHCETL